MIKVLEIVHMLTVANNQMDREKITNPDTRDFRMAEVIMHGVALPSYEEGVREGVKKAQSILEAAFR